MKIAEGIAAIQSCIVNRLEPADLSSDWLAGVIGDAPSHYSKSPQLWSAAFRSLGMKAIYLPMDVHENRLSDLVSALRDCERVLGVNVTVPYKRKIMDHLDALDFRAARIQAVNTIVRTDDGQLIGDNTDGEGFVESLLKPQPGKLDSFLESLQGFDVLLLGAGGSARAVAFHVAELLGPGQLLICNRTLEHAVSLAHELKKNGSNALAVPEVELPHWAPKVGLIINSTTKGQGGVRRLPDGMVTNLEPYSSLSAAHPPVFSDTQFSNADLQRRWFEAARSDIEANNYASMNLVRSIPLSVGFCDLIYHPEETVFLRHGRTSGHRTLNGKGMIIGQAAIALCQRICKQVLKSLGKDNFATYRQVTEVMYASW